MNAETNHPLRVFLCHASGDKPPVRDLYKRLVAEGVDAWLDQEKLLPGQDWRLEIPRAVKEADVVVVCLSNKSVTKEGYVQKEIKFALDIAEEKPEGTIFLIPARLEDCVVPERLSRWQWVDLYEENGFVRLLRSLKLRADAVGATMEPTSYENADREIERRLKQLYTEGLAAFYTEDWDRACQRFQSILSEQPNHKNAAEKLAEAERQRNLSKLYAQASEAVRSEDWGTAIKTLEELSGKSPDYKDAASLLRDVRKQEQLKELYAEANALHDAQKWEAVLKVFEQIAAIESNYPDPNRLLSSAQKEVAEIKRLADLNELYGNAVSEMDAGHWTEAQQMLEKVHKSQTGFLETERLLKKVEDEIAKTEDKNRRIEEVNVLYEQAHGLLRSKKWRNALDKMEEIRKLDDHFPDTDEIAEKARMELAREEQEAERQNQLAALYAEAVRLLKEEKYQEALDKWQEVRAVDPQYPDRQWVARTAKRKLQEVTQSKTKPDITKFDFTFINGAGSEWLLVMVLLGTMVIRAIFGVIIDWFHIWDPDSPLPPQILSLIVLGGIYGAIVALSLGRIIRNWGMWQSLTVIIGWAIGLGSALPTAQLGWDFIVSAMIVNGLSLAAAIKWAEPKIHWVRIAAIFICWVLTWKIGNPVGGYLRDTFATGYTWCLADAITLLFGLLATFGIYEHDSNRMIKLAGLSILGFALGNYVASGLWKELSYNPVSSVPISLTVWGFVGGVILELPSRDWKKILSKGALCGLGLLLGYIASLLILPNSMREAFPDRYGILRNVLWGAGLGLCFGLPGRRLSVLALLTVLGSSIFVFTSGYYAILSLGEPWGSVVRGALIGLVLGFGYAYATRDLKNNNLGW
jgi:outer membrane protein assembly factor BamD (BamD/ComL family)